MQLQEAANSFIFAQLLHAAVERTQSGVHLYQIKILITPNLCSGSQLVLLLLLLLFYNCTKVGQHYVVSCSPSGTRGSVSYKVSISVSPPSSLPVAGPRQKRLFMTTLLAGLKENSTCVNLSHSHPGWTCILICLIHSAPGRSLNTVF